MLHQSLARLQHAGKQAFTRTRRRRSCLNRVICLENSALGDSHWYSFNTFLGQSARFSTSSESQEHEAESDVLPMELPRVYRYLKLESFKEEEMEKVYTEIYSHVNKPKNEEGSSSMKFPTIDEDSVTEFLLQRIEEIDKENEQHFTTKQTDMRCVADSDERYKYAQDEARRLLRIFPQPLSSAVFVDTLTTKATEVDVKRIWPISFSILLVGTSVGVITPAMPFVVENLGLTPGQYGTVVSAFALSKMTGNIPSAILVERHGRKPYLTYSLGLIALGVGGIGAASSFEQLYICRLLTGAGVAALTTASQMTVSDISTPLNRAATFAPIASGFAAGTAMGPALGGFMVDQLGLHTTFYVVGLSYFGVTILNRYLLEETKVSRFDFPWYEKKTKEQLIDESDASKKSISSAVNDALSQWSRLMQAPEIRNVMVMNGFYWFALSGAQMTLLPLVLTNPEGLAMTATGVGNVYMGMSIVQVLSNPIMARYVVDRLGTGPSIGAGCAVIASAMAGLPLCQGDMSHLAGVLGLWAIGSSLLSTAPLSYISERVDEGKRAQAIAMLRTSGDLGFLFGAGLTGGLADWTGSIETAMQSSGGLLFLASMWFANRQILSSSGKTSSSHR